MPTISSLLAPAGWVIFSEDRQGNFHSLSLRNTKATKATINSLLADLSRLTISEGYTIKHYGEVAGVWSVLLQRQVQP